MTPECGRTARRGRRRPGTGLLLGLLFLSTPLSAGDDPAATARELQELRERIQVLQRELETGRERRDKLQGSLRDAEREISAATREVRELAGELVQRERHLANLDAERGQAQEGLAGLRRQLERDTRAAYVMGRQERVKLLLNQEDPASVGRMLSYYHYFAEARGARMAEVNGRLAEIARLERDIAAERGELVRLRDQREDGLRALTEGQQARQQLLARVRADMRDKGTELEQLTRDEQRLSELVRSLRELLSDIPAAPGDTRPFPERRGKLDWPVQGTVAASFGSRRALGDLTWRGILIRASLGAEVRAVSHGRVAFADWLRGFGLLIIVDHGEGYMTLYGHNQGLYKEAGEWVETGEVIASVGDGGSPGAAGLYFELRQNGRPVNPMSWIASR